MIRIVYGEFLVLALNKPDLDNKLSKIRRGDHSGFYKAIDVIERLEQENALLTKKLEGLEDIDEVSAGYRDLAKKAIEALSEYSFRDDFQKEFDKLQKEFEELGE